MVDKKGEIMKKLWFGIGVVLIIFTVIAIWFFKGPIVTKSQALYFGYSVIEKEFQMPLKEFKKQDFIAEKKEDGTWWVINRQMYDPTPGILGGGVGVIFTKNREDVQPFLLD